MKCAARWRRIFQNIVRCDEFFWGRRPQAPLFWKKVRQKTFLKSRFRAIFLESVEKLRFRICRISKIGLKPPVYCDAGTAMAGVLCPYPQAIFQHSLLLHGKFDRETGKAEVGTRPTSFLPKVGTCPGVQLALGATRPPGRVVPNPRRRRSGVHSTP